MGAFDERRDVGHHKSVKERKLKRDVRWSMHTAGRACKGADEEERCHEVASPFSPAPYPSPSSPSPPKPSSPPFVVFLSSSATTDDHLLLPLPARRGSDSGLLFGSDPSSGSARVMDLAKKKYFIFF